ncbi:MAG: hypothetical protein Tsb005_20210 [Gammaproteobacteria bacterium]
MFAVNGGTGDMPATGDAKNRIPCGCELIVMILHLYTVSSLKSLASLKAFNE